MELIGDFRSTSHAALLGCTALVTALSIGSGAHAQATSPIVQAADNSTNAVADIVVTAQKRQQNQQDVPVSLTAVTADALLANRITSVVDLGTAVPNLAARPTAGGAQTPAFTMRGITSYGVVAGSDKEISVYIDGVYESSTVGSSLDLPEVAQIEVLRGPQGTLFGRNATVGAVSVITRDPPHKFGLDQEFSVGNYNEFRSKSRIDSGLFGDFSASVSFVHEQRRGDIRNLGAGTTFTYPASSGFPGTLTSPRYLGDKNVNSVFAALKYDHGDLRVVDKFDWTGNHYTSSGAAVVGVYPPALGPAGGGFLQAVLATQTTPTVFDTTGQRPSTVNNSFTLPGYSRNWGDSLTAELRVSDYLSFKNVAAYRESYLRAANQLDGLGGLTVTSALASIPGFGGFAAIVGSPFAVFPIQQLTFSHQWSDEFQANFNSKPLTLTAGLLYFHQKGESGGPPGLANDIILEAIPFGNFGYINPPQPSRAAYANTSLAAYAQAELHVMSQLDLVGGIRVTNDKKTGRFTGVFNDEVTTTIYNPYNNTQPSYSVGVNYKPNRDVLIYAKYSEAFVAGGTSGPIDYKPEKAYSVEAGIKSDLLNHRLRANLAAYDVAYHDLQTAQSGTTVGQPEISLVVADLGNERAKGFELETTAVPAKGVTIGAAVGYTSVHFTYLNGAEISALGVPIALNNFFPSLQPKWTANFSGEYDTQPILGGARMTFRLDASWRDKELTDPYAVYQALPQYSSLTYAPATWLVNARVALEHIQLPAGEGQLAIWAKNLTNDKSITFPDIIGAFVGGTEFQAARTFGVDFSFKY